MAIPHRGPTSSHAVAYLARLAERTENDNLKLVYTLWARQAAWRLALQGRKA